MTWTWVQAVATAASALCGGFVGGATVAYRMGKWRQAVEDRLAAAEKRLEKGDNPIGQVPIVRVQVDALITELRALKQEVHDGLDKLVTRSECDRRHERDA